MKRMPILIGLAVALSTATVVAQTSSRWVDRTKTDVRAGRGSFYEIVDTVIKGDKVDVVKTEDRWLFVTTPRAKQGWVFEAALSASAVSPGGSDFLKLVPGDASTSATAASAGAKGVYAESYARQHGYDYSVVTWIEQNQPTPSEFDRFVADGGLAAAGGRQ
ncbi:MAG: SH3 domain-containing protein [Candidatus Rokuibacteriota bacterium]